MIRLADSVHAIEQKLNERRIALIGEIKKASPSKGVIRDDFHPPALASSFRPVVRSAFRSSPTALCFELASTISSKLVRPRICRRCARTSCSTLTQVDQARAFGADCILIIMAAVSDSEARALNTAAHDLNNGRAG